MRDIAAEFRGQMNEISSEIGAQEQLKKLADEDLNIDLPDLFESKKNAEDNEKRG